ncbi:hypothetical protein [Azospirillum soli]|uniref:hypothetical protein n=1 Tax=Azospirillum soli TaxID=1304799 RepID=UPI001AE7D7D4|nr:hypothetical protein [Azospirillum soli]MBP2315979.1 hypothetical protein [Azospirillum soli]
MSIPIKPPPPRPLALIYADGATPVEIAQLRRIHPQLVTAMNRGEPVADLLRHVEEQLAILNGEQACSAPATPRRGGARRPAGAGTPALTGGGDHGRC